MAEDTKDDVQDDVKDDAPAGVDPASFVPESFKTEDGKWDIEGFRRSYDDLSAFKSQADDSAAALPKDPSGYEFTLAEDHKLPEGFDPEAFATTDEKGNKIEFNPASMIDKDDPDVTALQSILHEAKVDPAVTKKLAGLLVNRELRQTIEANKTAAEEMKQLGPDAKARVDTVKRELSARLPAGYASAVADTITSADALRGIEQLIKKSPKPTTPASDQKDFSEMSPRDRILAGLNQRKSA